MRLTYACIVLGTLALCQPAFSEEHPGKKVFSKTCQGCHGPEGTGSQSADKLHKIKIPRLNSSYVQSFTDEQLAGIIMGGKGKMSAVRLGAPSQPHNAKKLTGDQITDVIGYVRTLKE